MRITSEMLRAARELLGWRQEDLARRAKVSLPTVKRLEKHPGPIKGRDATYTAVLDTLAKKAVVFVHGGREAGVLVPDAKATAVSQKQIQIEDAYRQGFHDAAWGLSEYFRKIPRDAHYEFERRLADWVFELYDWRAQKHEGRQDEPPKLGGLKSRGGAKREITRN